MVETVVTKSQLGAMAILATSVSLLAFRKLPKSSQADLADPAKAEEVAKTARVAEEKGERAVSRTLAQYGVQVSLTSLDGEPGKPDLPAVVITISPFACHEDLVVQLREAVAQSPGLRIMNMFRSRGTTTIILAVQGGT